MHGIRICSMDKLDNKLGAKTDRKKITIVFPARNTMSG